MGKNRTPDTGDAFRVPAWMHLLGGLVARHRRAWIRLGNLETRLLANELADIEITAPVYIAGLARSGSTLLLEILSRHPQVATHCYQDYPMLFTPYAWQRFLDRVPRRRVEPAERAHGDGVRITPESPEAFEEMLWMAFFPALHDPHRSAALDADTLNVEFETFYRDHIRKLLLARNAERYLSKGNYNVTRLAYLLDLFPDARFIIPVRNPVWHIASLMKQHRLFRAGQQAHHRAVEHLRRVGHFEFGLDRRPVNTGDAVAVEHILRCWRDGAEVEGWAR
ncbi:MAG: sulfotransferase, partial [Aquisalimonadaceae bacterium]